MKTLTSLKHPLVTHWFKLNQSKEYRCSTQRLLIPGMKMVQEAAKLGPIITLIMLESSASQLDHLPAKEKIRVSIEILKKITGLPQPEDVAAEISLPQSHTLEKKNRLVVLDGVSDPGNVGTLIRSAHALGWDGLFLLEKCCDPFNPKALRASKGASLKLPLRIGSLTELLSLLEQDQYHVLIADPKGNSFDKARAKLPCALILGSESHGIQPALKKRYASISIPMHTTAESLNVAACGAIMMYYLGTAT